MLHSYAFLYRLLSTVEPGIELEKSEKPKKKKKGDEFKGIDASLIIRNSDKTEHDFMGTLNEYAPDPSDCISVQP